MSIATVAIVLVLTAAVIALLGVFHSRRHAGTLEDHITARGTLGKWAGAATLVATGLGTWILFGPAEAATWGGISAVLGYAVGAGGFCFLFIPLGRRMREVMPDGHSLTEYLWHRFGRPIYVLTLVAMLFYMFIFLTAELTGVALIVALIADIPLWVTAAIVMAATLAYTLYGGLRASIFTDSVQLVIILPVVLTALVAGWIAVGGASGFTAGLAEHAPHLTDLTFKPGLEGGLALALAVTLTNLFHQGYWQRVFAAKDAATLRSSFFAGGVVSLLTVFALGLFGLAYVALGKEGVSSTAVFDVLFDAVPVWVMLAVMVAGLALVMSSADTIINAVASIIVVDLGRAVPAMQGPRLLAIARVAILVAAVPIVFAAAQGYSVLYLFLLADLICSALAFPVFFGLYSARYDAVAAAASIVAGLVAGGLLFPDPSLSSGSLIGAFALAFVVPIAVSALFLMVRRRTGFDFALLRTAVRPISG
jgi:Na+/proline symporter